MQFRRTTSNPSESVRPQPVRTSGRSKGSSLLFLALFLAMAPVALASNAWYVDGVNGSDANDCKSTQTACKTIGHAISLASSGHSIKLAPATYTENLTINISLNIIGSDAKTTIVDGGGNGTVVTISSANAHVILSKLTIQNGAGSNGATGGISNGGTLTINNSTISANFGSYGGGGIYNGGTLTINNSTISANFSSYYGGGICNGGTLKIDRTTIKGNSAAAWGGGIYNGYGTVTIDNGILSGNSAYGGSGIYNAATLTINNSTLSGNSANQIGGIDNWDTLTINNSTLSGNSAYYGGGIGNHGSATATLQNSIVANSPSGGNCYGTMTSNGYNLSSDNTCNFNGPGDMNNTDPKLGALQNNGGPTQTMRLLCGSPAVDAGNPTGCTDGNGHLLLTDQRGWPRSYHGVCDMGAFERQW